MTKDDRSILYIRIDNEMKKKLKLVSVYEEVSVTDIVVGFIQYGLMKYENEQTLISNK
jgi:hypothetical protein